MAKARRCSVLEERGACPARGAPDLRRVCAATGLPTMRIHMTAPRPDGRQAGPGHAGSRLRDAHLAPSDIGYINAHGCPRRSTIPTETASIKQVFGDHAYRLALSGPRDTTAMPWARAAPSRPPSAPCRYGTAGCRPPSISRLPIPPATWITSGARARRASRVRATAIRSVWRDQRNLVFRRTT
jgi:hypothetical protein